MQFAIILFWCCAAIVLYTYLGYGIILGLLVKLKKMCSAPQKAESITNWPDVTFVICAYNEEKVVDEKMENCNQLDYPSDKLHILWVTDGSNDRTNEFLAKYPDAEVLFTPERRGKTAALNHAATVIHTPYTIYTDANTMVNSLAVKEIVTCFLRDSKVGCVAGEKRIANKQKDNAAGGGEGLYWKYESTLKRWDSELYSAMGAAGELFAIRSALWENMEEDTLLDDFVLSMRIVKQGHTIAYCKEAYAIESSSADMAEEQKRKVRISAGGLQSIWRLRSLLNPFPHPLISFQFVSHRVLRWSITPFALFALIPLNIALVVMGAGMVYIITLVLQVLFYVAGGLGYYLQSRQIKNKWLFVPYYFLFMNVNVLQGIAYLMKKQKGSGVWEKAKRA
ncbi:MAG: glycosyltransferase family 2 protein [Bacteroidaceae bacterium]|nr:glycosyltransferase family 2 protein [Bacteroidaceae bacterium]